MIVMRFRTPVDGFNGAVGGIRFVDGVGETDDANLIAYFTRQGYEAEEATPADETKDETSTEKAPSKQGRSSK